MYSENYQEEREKETIGTRISTINTCERKWKRGCQKSKCTFFQNYKGNYYCRASPQQRRNQR